MTTVTNSEMTDDCDDQRLCTGVLDFSTSVTLYIVLEHSSTSTIVLHLYPTKDWKLEGYVQ